MVHRLIVISAFIAVATAWATPAEAARPVLSTDAGVIGFSNVALRHDHRDGTVIQVARDDSRRRQMDPSQAIGTQPRPIRDWRALLHGPINGLQLHGVEGYRADGRARVYRVDDRPAAFP
jgi:hypothetical protein